MTKTQLREALKELPVEEQRELLEELWEDVVTTAPLPEWQKKILDERVAEADKNPSASRPWNEVKKEVFPDLA